MKNILIINKYFYPSYKSGGPVRTLTAMVNKLQDFIHFKTVTTDRDFEAVGPYKDIEVNAWNQTPFGDVLYLGPERRTFSSFWRILAEQDADGVYFNSFFCSVFTTMPLLILKSFPPKGKKGIQIILAPRGEFSQGALALKSTKKKWFILFSKLIGLHRNIIWHASTTMEADDIRKFYPNAEIRIAEDMAILDDDENLMTKRRPKEAGSLRAIFLSRIDPKKNLDGALKMLREVRIDGEINFDIYGPITNLEYWGKCRVLMEELPQNIKVRYMGEVPHDKVRDTFAKYDFFLFPTHGENFGHVILESLSAGTPVLTTDQTPWEYLVDEKAGWIISPDDVFRGSRAIGEILLMSGKEHETYSVNARQVAEKKLCSKAVLEANRLLFR